MPSRMPEEVRRPPRILRRQVRPRVRISGRRPATHRRTYESAGARDLERVLKPAAPVTLTRSHGHPPEYPACTWNPAWMLSKTAGFVRFSHTLWPMPRTDCERWSDPGGLLFETPIVVVIHGYSQRQGPVGIVLGGAPGGGSLWAPGTRAIEGRLRHGLLLGERLDFRERPLSGRARRIEVAASRAASRRLDPKSLVAVLPVVGGEVDRSIRVRSGS